MKKLMTLTAVLLCVLFSFNLNAVNNYVEVNEPEEVEVEPGNRGYAGMLTWYGEEGIALFYEPNVSFYNRDYWVRQFPSMASVRQDGNIVYVTIQKEEWIMWGSPNPLSFTFFYGYSPAGSVTLYIPDPE